MYEEWKDLLRLAKEGDMDSKEEILNRLKPLIIKSIQSYYNRRELYEELIQEGNLCILEAIESFDEGKKIYFLGYAKTQLRYLYLNKNKTRHHGSLNVLVGENKSEELQNTLPSNDTTGPEGLIEEETYRELEDSLSYLTARQRQVVLLFYAKKMSITDIAKELGVSYRTIVNTKTRALEKLRERVQN